MRIIALIVAGCLCAAASAQEPVRVTITTDPVPADVNLLHNPGFEEVGADGIPVYWEYNTAAPDHIAFERSGDAHSGENCWRVTSDSQAWSGYLQQPVALEPVKSYRAWTWLRLAGGRYMMLLRGSVNAAGQAPTHFDERSELISTRNHWMAPLYFDPAHLQGPPPDQWLLRPQDFTAPEGLTSIRVWLGSYFRVADMAFDDTYLGPATCTLTLRVEADRPLKMIRVNDLLRGPAVYQTDDLPADTMLHEVVVEDARIAAGYRVFYDLGDGPVEVWIDAN